MKAAFSDISTGTIADTLWLTNLPARKCKSRSVSVGSRQHLSDVAHLPLDHSSISRIMPSSLFWSSRLIELVLDMDLYRSWLSLTICKDTDDDHIAFE